MFGSVLVYRLGFAWLGKLGSLSFGLHALLWILIYGRGKGLIHTHDIDTPLLVGWLLSFLPRTYWIATVHGAHRISEKLHTFWGRRRLRLMQNRSDHIVAVSTESEKMMRDFGFPSEVISLIPNGLDVDFYIPPDPKARDDLRMQHGYAPDEFVVLFLGRLIRLKRPDLLLRAFPKVLEIGDAKCIIVGDGPEMDGLRLLADNLDIAEHVLFTGFASNVRDFYWISDAFVLPSRSEGLPVALLEAMACGLPVVVSRCAGNLEIVTDEYDGLTFEIDNPDHLAKQLKRLQKDDVLREQLVGNARVTVTNHYSIGAIAEEHIKIYSGPHKTGLANCMADG
jgi:glycosyltransferase involved in cell wall biosynthesis